MSHAAQVGFLGGAISSECLVVTMFQMMGTKLLVGPSAHAPSEATPGVEKDAFQKALQTAIDQAPWETMVLLGDINAWLGGEISEIWQGHLGSFVLPEDKMVRGCCRCVWPMVWSYAAPFSGTHAN